MISLDVPLSSDRPNKPLGQFTQACTDIVRALAGTFDPNNVYAMTQHDQQKIVDKLNPHVKFEYAQSPDIHGLPLTVTGYGLMFVTDEEGAILGAETVSDGDVVLGELSEVCALPVPTLESVSYSDAESTPILGQVFSGVLILKNATFKTGLNRDGTFEEEHDLTVLGYQIGIPLSHPFYIE